MYEGGSKNKTKSRFKSYVKIFVSFSDKGILINNILQILIKQLILTNYHNQLLLASYK